MVVKIYLKESYLRAFSRIKYDKNTPTKSGKKAKGLFLPPLSRYPPYSTHMIQVMGAGVNHAPDGPTQSKAKRLSVGEAG